MKVHQPFKRFRKMLAEIEQAKLLQGVAKMLALDQIAPYQSRGKGRNSISPRFGKSREGHTPHYGKKESAKLARKENKK